MVHATKEILLVRFGESDESCGLEPFEMTEHQFEVVGTKVLTHLGKQQRKSDFQYVVRLFELWEATLTELAAFLILEELAVLMDEMSGDPDVLSFLQGMHTALAAQVFLKFTATVEALR